MKKSLKRAILMNFDGVLVAEIIQGFKLEPIVAMAERFSKDARKQGGIPAGVAVIGYGKIYRTTMRRLVTALE